MSVKIVLLEYFIRQDLMGNVIFPFIFGTFWFCKVWKGMIKASANCLNLHLQMVLSDAQSDGTHVYIVTENTGSVNSCNLHDSFRLT